MSQCGKQDLKLASDTIPIPGIYFNYDYTITFFDQTRLANCLKSNSKFSSILVYGFTDNSGTLSYNQHLSQQRADFVAHKLRQLTNKPVIVKDMGPSDRDVDLIRQRRVDVYPVK